MTTETAPAAFGRSILILAPHPDDEVVACCAAAGRARAAGAQVNVLYLTHGRVDRETDWSWRRQRHDALVLGRRQEAWAAAGELGLRPVGWPNRPARRLWTSLAAIEAEVREAIETLAIDQIWTLAFEGRNPDQDGANAVASRFAAAGADVLEFAACNFAGGKLRSHIFADPNGAEEVLVLSPDERAAKQAALALYASEARNLGRTSLKTETFRPLPAHDYRRPPHPGRLSYTRLQWVPFAHPAIDRTDPDDVAAAIKAYLATDPPKLLRQSPSRPLTRA